MSGGVGGPRFKSIFPGADGRPRGEGGGVERTGSFDVRGSVGALGSQVVSAMVGTQLLARATGTLAHRLVVVATGAYLGAEWKRVRSGSPHV